MKNKILLIVMAFSLIFSISGCGNKTNETTNEQVEVKNEKIEHIIDTKAEEKTIDVVPLLNATMIYMYENNGVYSVQNEDCYWGILQRMFSLYDLEETNNISSERVKEYGDIICYFDELPSVDGLEYVRYKDDVYSFTEYKNDNLKCETVYMYEDEVGNIDTTIRLYDKNNNLLSEADFSLEKLIKDTYEDDEICYTIKMIEYYKEGSRMVIGSIKEISLEEITILSGNREFNLTYLDGEIVRELKDMQEGNFIMVLTKNDVIIENHSNEPLVLPEMPPKLK